MLLIVRGNIAPTATSLRIEKKLHQDAGSNTIPSVSYSNQCVTVFGGKSAKWFSKEQKILGFLDVR